MNKVLTQELLDSIRVSAINKVKLHCSRITKRRIVNDIDQMMPVNLGKGGVGNPPVSLFGIPVELDNSIPAGTIRLIGSKGVIQEWLT